MKFISKTIQNFERSCGQPS